MAELYDKLHIMTKHPTKYDSYQQPGVAFKSEIRRMNEQTNERKNGQTEKKNASILSYKA